MVNFPSPVNCLDATLYGFFLQADSSPLAKLCRKVFADRTRGRIDVRPLVPLVMLTFGTVKRIEPLLEPWSRMGFAKERQVALWIPVLASTPAWRNSPAAGPHWPISSPRTGYRRCISSPMTAKWMFY